MSSMAKLRRRSSRPWSWLWSSGSVTSRVRLCSATSEALGNAAANRWPSRPSTTIVYRFDNTLGSLLVLGGEPQSARRLGESSSLTGQSPWVVPSPAMSGTGPGDRRGVEEGRVEEVQDAAPVLLGPGLQPLDVADVAQRPRGRAGADQLLVERVDRLAVAAVGRPDQEHRPRRDPRQDIDEAGRGRLV